MSNFRLNLNQFRPTGSVAVVLFALFLSVSAQKLVDKTVASVSDGLRTELITLSDLRWELALTRNARVTPPSSEDLNAALLRLIDQRIWVLEANRIPRNPVTKDEVSAEIKRILSFFPTAGEFESRLREVGFNSVDDKSFEELIANRIAIEKFLDFRFRSFIVIAAKDEEKYYNDVYAPNFRIRFPGVEVPSLEASRPFIRKVLIEDRVEADMESFLDIAKQRMTITIISPV